MIELSDRTVASTSDDGFMRRALSLAEGGRGFVEPNPRVGCVIVRDGDVIGEGFHRRFGGPHAEVDALSQMVALEGARGATVYVTLEPCCHTGKTPPCTDALVTAGVARVVVAMEDPFPAVAGGGIGRLREAGIEVVIGVLRREAEALNRDYLKRLRTGKPWVIAKWAMTLDGKIATVSGKSRWITGQTSRADVHRQRGLVDAIAVGMNTVVADDPELTARPVGRRVATRVVFCRTRLPDLSSRLIATLDVAPLQLFVTSNVDQNRCDALRQIGVAVHRVEVDDPGEMVAAALEELGRKRFTQVIIEGGGQLLGSFFSAGEVDACQIYVGPKIFGSTAAIGPIGGPGVREVSEAWPFRLESVDRFDHDLKLSYVRSDLSGTGGT